MKVTLPHIVCEGAIVVGGYASCMLLLTEDCHRVLWVDRGLGSHATVYVGFIHDKGGGAAAVTLHYCSRL
jgi:hypothetical protein